MIVCERIYSDKSHLCGLNIVVFSFESVIFYFLLNHHLVPSFRLRTVEINGEFNQVSFQIY